MLRAKRRRTRTHDKDGNPIFNTMNSTPLQSVYKNVNNNFKQSNCCEKTIACRYNNCGTTTKDGEKYTCCWSSKNRNPIPGYRKKLDCTRSTCTNLAYFAVQETNDGFGVAASIKDIYTDSGFIIPQVGSVKNFADCAFISAILQYSSDCKTRIDITAYGMPAIYNGIYYLISNAPSPIYKNNNGKFLGLYYGSIAGGAGVGVPRRFRRSAACRGRARRGGGRLVLARVRRALPGRARQRRLAARLHRGRLSPRLTL